MSETDDTSKSHPAPLRVFKSFNATSPSSKLGLTILQKSPPDYLHAAVEPAIPVLRLDTSEPSPRNQLLHCSSFEPRVDPRKNTPFMSSTTATIENNFDKIPRLFQKSSFNAGINNQKIVCALQETVPLLQTHGSTVSVPGGVCLQHGEVQTDDRHSNNTLMTASCRGKIG